MNGSQNDDNDNEIADDDFLPNELRCAITLELMADPQVAADGNTYEHAAIRAWLDRQSRASQPCSSPLTGESMAHSRLVPNLALKRLVREWPQIVARLIANSNLSAAAAASNAAKQSQQSQQSQQQQQQQPPPAVDARRLRLLSAALNERDMTIVSLKAQLTRSLNNSKTEQADAERELRVLKQRVAALEMQISDMRTRVAQADKVIADVHALTRPS
jgi:hypothetical protein